MTGWIKTYKSLLNHWLSQDMEKLGRWMFLLLSAAHEDTKEVHGNRIIELKQGQLVASNSFLAKRWNTSERTVLRFLEMLESDGMLHRCTHQKITIITICNYESYQEKKKGKRTDECSENAPMTHRWRTHPKKNKEDILVLVDNNNAPAHTHEGSREEYYQDRYRLEGGWTEAAMMSHLSIDEVKKVFEEFIIEQKHNSREHLDYPDFKTHFLNYLRKKAEILRRQNKQDNGNNRTNQRRGIQSVVNSVEDYEGSF